MATDLDSMTDAELEAATAPTAPGSGEVSQAELEQRMAKGLQAAFDDDDDDLDEELKPIDESKKGEEAKADDEEGEEGEKEEAEKEPEAEADPNAITDELKEAAKLAGLDADKFKDRAALEASLEAIAKLFHDEGERIIEEEEARAAPEKPKAEDRPRDDAGRFVEKKDTDFKLAKFEALKEKAKDGDFAPELIEALDEMLGVVAELRAEAGVTKQERAAEQKRRQEAAAEAAEREIDSFFDEIAKENPVWAETFGTAKAAELLRTTEGKKLFQNRMAVLKARDNYAAGLESRKQPTPASRKLLESGLTLAFREKLSEAAERKLADKLRERTRGAPPRPNSRKSPSEKGSALREAMKRHGLRPDDE